MLCLAKLVTRLASLVKARARSLTIFSKLNKCMLYIDIVITAILYSMYINQQLTNSY